MIEEREPTLLVGGHILVTGQIPRVTTFEKGMPAMHKEVRGQWQPDPWMYDDQSIVINVRNKGLVVLTACSHAGLINILQYARNLTGVSKTYAVIGGLGIISDNPNGFKVGQKMKFRTLLYPGDFKIKGKGIVFSPSLGARSGRLLKL